jgi:catalase
VSTLAEESVDAISDLYGRYPGCRAAHAKGIVCRGTFTATPDAASLTRAAHMQGDPVEATVRFSTSSGNPRSCDFVPDFRGMGTKFYLPDGSRTDIIGVTLPRFLGTTPEDFIRFTRAFKAGGECARNKMRLRRLEFPRFLLYMGRRKRLRRTLETLGWLGKLKPIASFATGRYNAFHAFKWVDAIGNGTYVRYSWLPAAGETSISHEEGRRRGPDYLRRELLERLEREPVRFTLQLQIAGESDEVDDAMAAWPAERETLIAGTLVLTGLDMQRQTGGDVLVFDPMRLTDGIEPSMDPILRFRPLAYEVSVERRTAVADGGAP